MTLIDALNITLSAGIGIFFGYQWGWGRGWTWARRDAWDVLNDAEKMGDLGFFRRWLKP